MKHNSNDSNKETNSIPMYFKLGWELWKDYYKPFIGAQLIALATFSGVAAIIILSMFTMGNGSATIIIVLDSFGLLKLLLIFFLFPAYIIEVAFMGSLYGMGNEIVSSGDYFTSLKSSFTYFKKYWWQYSLVAVIQLIILLSYSGIIFFFIEESIGIIIFICIEFFWFSLCYLLSAALASTGSIKKAIKHSFLLFKKDPRTILILSILSIVPIVMLDVILSSIMSIFFPDSIIVLIIQIVFILITFFFYIPYITLIETIVYHAMVNQEGLNGS